jgi:HD-GYP domain-containing protein (c-di-GMP phosphodiesterase class II)
MIPQMRADEHATILSLHQMSVSTAFHAKLRTTLDSGEEAVDRLLRSYDPSMADHHRAVADLAVGIANRIGLPQHEARGIGLAASLHDIGIVGDPGLVDPDDRTTVFDPASAHACTGATIVDGIRFPWPIQAMILQHHEHMDGSGQPYGLGGDAILMSSRVLTVADVVASRPPTVGSLHSALAELADGRGTRFDADAVDACLDLFPMVAHRPVHAVTCGP